MFIRFLESLESDNKLLVKYIKAGYTSLMESNSDIAITQRIFEIANNIADDYNAIMKNNPPQNGMFASYDNDGNDILAFTATFDKSAISPITELDKFLVWNQRPEYASDNSLGMYVPNFKRIDILDLYNNGMWLFSDRNIENNAFSALVHELSHAMDYSTIDKKHLRTAIRTKSNTDTSANRYEYFNRNTEISAYLRQWMVDNLKWYRIQQMYKTNDLKRYRLPEWYRKLNDANKRAVLKRMVHFVNITHDYMLETLKKTLTENIKSGVIVKRMMKSFMNDIKTNGTISGEHVNKIYQDLFPLAKQKKPTETDKDWKTFGPLDLPDEILKKINLSALV